MRKILYLLVLFGAFSASAQRFVRYFDTVTDMAASNPADPNVYVVVGGAVSFNDNQAARWKWVSGSVDPADGNTVVSTWAGGWPGKPAGRWKKINEASGIVIDTSGFITNYNVVVVNDKASLQNINVTNNIAVALVKGKYGLNDGWEGQFTFNAASTAVADDAFYVAPNTGVGMWERQTPNPLREIPATWFDPNLTNGVIQAAINYAASLSTNAVPGREVLLPPKFIEINGNTGLNMSNNVTLVGQNGTVLATSAGTVAGYQMIRANGVTNWGVKNLQLIGLASVGGYGIFVTNSSRGVWGGITFATNFTTAPVWITNSSEIVPFDDKWVKNSVRAYGAQGNNLNDDTVPFSMAVRNTPAQVGDRVIVPPGSYANNLWLTSAAGLVLEALNQGGQGVTNYTLTPFYPTLPVIRIGTNSNPAGYPNRSITMRGLMFDYRGPFYTNGTFSSYGQIGLSIRGGVESVYLDNCEWQGFSQRGVELIGGSINGAGVENITFNNPNVQLSNDSATNDTYGLYLQYSETANGPSDLTFVTFINGKYNGANNGAIIKSAGVHTKMFGGYLDGSAPYMIVATNWGAGHFPLMQWSGTTFDNHSGTNNNVIVDEFTGSFPWLSAATIGKEGTAEIYWNGTSYPAYDYASISTNMVYQLLVLGTLRFNLPGTYYEEPGNYIANDSARNLIAVTTNNFVWTHESGKSFQVQSPDIAKITLNETDTNNTYHLAFLSQETDNTRLFPGGRLRFDNSLGNRVMYIETNATSDSIIILTNAMGFRAVGPVSKITMLGNQSAATTADVALGTTETNILGGVRAAMVIQQQADHTDDISTATVQGLTIEIGTSARATNMTGPLEGLRLNANMRHTNGAIDTVIGLHIGVPQTNGLAESITSTNIAIMIDSQGVAATNYAMLTGSGRHDLGGTIELTPAQPFTLLASDQITTPRSRAIVTGSGTPVILTNTPTIPAGYDGQVLIVTGASSIDTVELIDQGTLPGSNISLGTGVTNRVLGKGDTIMLVYVGGTITNWCAIR